MQHLEALTREAHALATGEIMILDATTSEAEVTRVMQICNACRYCEGFCAVFPAMTRRLEFQKNDVHLLANLCHNCGACLHACQYAPPHEFAVNVPRAMAQVRVHTYSEFAWPKALGALYRRNGLTLALATAGGLAFFLLLMVWQRGVMSEPVSGANFYSVFPHNLLAILFGAVFLYAAVALGIGVMRFWRAGAPGASPSPAASFGEAAHDVLSLRYLGGGHGEGCNNENDAFSLARRRFHHLTFYGFMLCFAATCVATGYHYLLGYEAPYPLLSVPVLLGLVGGVGLLVGPTGLLWLNLGRHPLQGDPAQKPMDRGFIALLLLTGATGLILLATRASIVMPVWLAIHLGCVMGLFLTMPYGKFAHGIYRSAALLKWAIEKRTPANLKLAED